MQVMDYINPYSFGGSGAHKSSKAFHFWNEDQMNSDQWLYFYFSKKVKFGLEVKIDKVIVQFLQMGPIRELSQTQNTKLLGLKNELNENIYIPITSLLRLIRCTLVFIYFTANTGVLIFAVHLHYS